MKIKNLFFTVFFIAAGIYFYQTFFFKKTDSSVLVVGTSPDFHPFCFIDEQGKITGFDIDVITEVAHRLNKKIQFEDRPFNTLILELTGNQIDIIASGTTPSEERKKHILFTDIILQGDPLVVLSKEPIRSLEELLQKNIISVTGYTADSYLSNLNPVKPLIRLKNPSEALLALQSNAGDAFVSAKNAIQGFLEQHHTYHIWEIPNTGDSYAFAVRLGNHELCNQINSVLAAMKGDGTLQALIAKWKMQ